MRVRFVLDTFKKWRRDRKASMEPEHPDIQMEAGGRT